MREQQVAKTKLVLGPEKRGVHPPNVWNQPILNVNAVNPAPPPEATYATRNAQRPQAIRLVEDDELLRYASPRWHSRSSGDPERASHLRNECFGATS